MTWDQTTRFAVALVIASVLGSGAIGTAAQNAGFDEVMARMSVPRVVDGAWVLPSRSARGGAAVEDYAGMIAEACATYGCDPGYVSSIMYCESNGDPSAVAYNPSSGNYTRGLMQIDDLWGVSMDPADQIWWSAKMISQGYGYLWVCG